MLIRALPLLAGLLPIVAANIAYWMGVEAGHLPACFPYIEGCTSISSTGRHPPGSFLFRIVYLPQSVLLVWVWYLAAGWLESLDGSLSSTTRFTMLTFGVVGAVALAIYTTYLGTSEPVYEFMRRFGIYFYFLGTAVAQLVVAFVLVGWAQSARRTYLLRLARTMLWLVLLPFALGILNLVLKAILDDSDRWENRIEWIAALMMQAWFVVMYLAWRDTGIRSEVSTRLN